jgi:hypothetical protein
MTRSISKSTVSRAGDALSEYQKGVLSARDCLRALFSRNATENARAARAADAPERPDPQR